MRRVVVMVLLGLVVVLAVALHAPAGGGANQAVLANATADDSSAARSGVQVTVTGSPTLDSDNLAKATSTSCTGCRTVAVALQAVIGTGSPDTVTPSNAAVAVNSGCTSCTSYAYAYQYVATGARSASFTPEAQQRIAAIRARAAELAGSDLGLDELTLELDGLAAELKEVASTDLRPTGGTDSRRVDRAA